MANTPNYMNQGGEEWVIEGTLDASTGVTKVNTPVDDEDAVPKSYVDSLGNFIPVYLNFEYTAGSTNEALVGIAITDPNGIAVNGKKVIEIWLSDAATGAGETATTASGSVQSAGTGTDLLTLTAKKRLRVETDETGQYQLSITDSAKTAFYPVVQMGLGTLAVGSALATDDYGA